ncbi:hypothetical protein D918_08073 [Trichuris suis]|nr:hypothetical protein D918_08073 [Trichuris suis]
MVYEPVSYPDKSYSNPHVLDDGVSSNRCIKVCLHSTTTSLPRVLKRRNGFLQNRTKVGKECRRKTEVP